MPYALAPDGVDIARDDVKAVMDRVRRDRARVLLHVNMPTT